MAHNNPTSPQFLHLEIVHLEMYDVPVPTRNGYIFKAWHYNSNFSCEGILYSDSRFINYKTSFRHFIYSNRTGGIQKVYIQAEDNTFKETDLITTTHYFLHT